MNKAESVKNHQQSPSINSIGGVRSPALPVGMVSGFPHASDAAMRCTRRAYASPRRKPSSTIGKISLPPPSLSLSLVLGLTRVRLISPLHSSRAPNLKWADVCEVDVRDGTRQTRMASRDGEARPLMDLPLSLSLSLFSCGLPASRWIERLR